MIPYPRVNFKPGGLCTTPEQVTSGPQDWSASGNGSSGDRGGGIEAVMYDMILHY